MLTSLLNAWRDKPPVVDYLIMLGVAGCGLFEASWLVLPLGDGLPDGFPSHALRPSHAARISASSSLLNGYDDPKILRSKNSSSVS
jgi:hypothetical protein